MADPARPPAEAPLRVIEVDPAKDPRWETFVTSHPDGVIYHHPAWVHVLQEEYGQPPVGLVCEDAGGQLQGVLALLRTRGLPLGLGGISTSRRLSSLPRTPVSGPLAVNVEAAAALVQAAVHRTQAHPGTQLQLKVSSRSLEGMADRLTAVPWRLSYVLNLTENPDEPRLGSGRARRRNLWSVNKARRLGVQVRVAQTEGDLRAWYPLYLDTMRYLVVPPRSYRFFKALWEILRPVGFMKLLLAEQDGIDRRLLAGSVFLMLGHTVFYAFTGWRRADHSLRANDLIHWDAIQDARAQGFRYYDFGEVADGQQGLAGFKSKWGGEPRQLYRYLYPAPGRVAGGIAESGRAPRLVRAAWPRLPLRATALIGDWFYSYL